MTAPGAEQERLSIELERELVKKVRTAAAERDVSVRDFVAEVLQQAVSDRDDPSPTEWSSLSTPSFARDWNSEDDDVYDRLAQG